MDWYEKAAQEIDRDTLVNNFPFFGLYVYEDDWDTVGDERIFETLNAWKSDDYWYTVEGRDTETDEIVQVELDSIVYLFPDEDTAYDWKQGLFS